MWILFIFIGHLMDGRGLPHFLYYFINIILLLKPSLEEKCRERLKTKTVVRNDLLITSIKFNYDFR